MNTPINQKEFYQGAMFCGTLLGGVWSLMYLLLFAGTTNTIALLLCMVLFFSSPIMAIRIANAYRKKACNDTMTYLQAWNFTFYMYICATLLSTLISFIYFRFFDGGEFFMTIQTLLEETMRVADTDQALTQQIEQTKNIIEQTTTSSFVWQIMSNNLTNSIILPLIIAIFVKKSPKDPIAPIV